MPYVNVPNDLSKIKTKIAFNLTKRQLGAGDGPPRRHPSAGVSL